MHEYSIVEEMIEKLRAEFKDKNIDHVSRIRLRRGSTFHEGPLRQAFEMLSDDPVFSGTELDIEEFQVEHTCENCSKTHTVNADDLIGHLFICPDCGKGVELDEAHGLELLGIVV